MHILHANSQYIRIWMGIKVDLNRLIEFNTIAELGSFTKAAEQLGVSTAVLSVRFSKFEDQIGQKLFERNSRSVELTDAGQRFIADSQDIINDYFSAIRLSQSAAVDYRLNLRIAVEGLSVPSRLSNVIMQLNAKYLSLHVSLSEDPVWSDLTEGRIQLYIGCSDDPPDSRIEKKSFGRAKQFIVVPRTHRLATKSEATFDDLENEKILLYPDTRLPGIRSLQTKMIADSGINCTIVNDKISKTYYFDYISMGMAIALLPFNGYPVTIPPSLSMVLLEPRTSRLNTYMYYLNDTYNPVLDSIIRKLERHRATLEDYGWIDSDDN